MSKSFVGLAHEYSSHLVHIVSDSSNVFESGMPSELDHEER